VTAEVRPVAGDDDWSVVAWLWQAYKHDLAPVVGAYPRADGRYNRTQLDTWSAAPDTAAYVAWEGDAPVGFAVVVRLAEPPTGMGAFWVAPVVRRTGLGRRLARDVIGRHPGAWEIAFQQDNQGAGRFWRLVADEMLVAWTEDQRAVPGKPDVPPDTWISGSTRL
jgi:predicted acetyltransferase